MKKESKKKPFIISLVMIVIGVAAYYHSIPFLDFMELKTIDLRFRHRGEIPPKSDVVIAVIDEESLAREGKWVWPRSKLAKLVTMLSHAGAKVIACDIGFLEPDDHKQIAQDIIENIKKDFQSNGIQGSDLDEYLKKLDMEQFDNDKRLADAIGNSSAKVVLGHFFHMKSEPVSAPDGNFVTDIITLMFGNGTQPGSRTSENRDQNVYEEKIENSENSDTNNIHGSEYKVVKYLTHEPPLFYKAESPQTNIGIISASTDISGFFNMSSDADGVVRQMPGIIEYKGGLYASLPMMAASAYKDASPWVRVDEYGTVFVEIANLSVPLNAHGEFLINYRGGEKSFPHISVTKILNKEVPATELKDKIVLVGVTAVGVYDLRLTPFENVYPGVEIHANVIDCILSEDYLHRSDLAFLDVMAIVAGGCLTGLGLLMTGVTYGWIIALSLFALHILLCSHMFSSHGLILNMVYPLSVIVLTYLSISMYRYLTEARQKKFIRNAFSTYLAPSVVDQLIRSPEKLVLGGEERVITAFFSDVQGFTSISEKLTPQELVDLLNEFLTEMTDIILRHKGTVDKFEGDAIIAFFGAPNELRNQAQAACMACADMQKRLAELRQNWKEQGKPELQMRIGLYTGPAVVGNMGSKSRMDYTMMGDTVNTAARLEGVNKVYGIYTLIGETTRREAGNRIVTREIDSINVVGKKEPVTVYQILGYARDMDDTLMEVMDYYAEGLSAYRTRHWDNAIHFFEQALSIAPDDGPARAMLTRCHDLKASPPDETWNGSFTMKTK